MSRIAKRPIKIPNGVKVTINDSVGIDPIMTVKGPKGELQRKLSHLVQVKQEENVLHFSAVNTTKKARSMSGTLWAHVNNMVIGVTQGFQKKLQLVGVGYRAQVSGKKIILSVGYSQNKEYEVDEQISASTSSQTEIVLECINKEILGQTAANIRSIRPPEPYKGKGIRYVDEYVRRKETKKK